MPSLKKHKRSAPPRRATPPRDPDEPNQDDGGDGAANDVSSDDFLMVGSQAEKKAKEQAAQYARRVREFFVTKKEVAESATGNVEVRVHMAVNYAEVDVTDDALDFHNIIAVATVQIPAGNNRFETYTSPANGDCAFRAAGLNPSIRPCFVLMDHRAYTTQDGRTFKDDIKVWRPSTAQLAQMKQAIRNLAENLGIDPEDPKGLNSIDLTDYECVITKLGAGKRSSWSINFIVRPKPLTDDQKARIAKWYGLDPEKDGTDVSHAAHVKKMRQILAPDPRYLISEGGSYTKPNSNAGNDPTGTKEERPF